MPTLRRSKSLNDKITRQKNRTGDVIRDPRSPDVEGRTRTCVDNFQALVHLRKQTEDKARQLELAYNYASNGHTYVRRGPSGGIELPYAAAAAPASVATATATSPRQANPPESRIPASVCHRRQRSAEGRPGRDRGPGLSRHESITENQPPPQQNRRSSQQQHQQQKCQRPVSMFEPRGGGPLFVTQNELSRKDQVIQNLTESQRNLNVHNQKLLSKIDELEYQNNRLRDILNAHNISHETHNSRPHRTMSLHGTGDIIRVPNSSSFSKQTSTTVSPNSETSVSGYGSLAGSACGDGYAAGSDPVGGGRGAPVELQRMGKVEDYDDDTLPLSGISAGTLESRNDTLPKSSSSGGDSRVQTLNRDSDKSDIESIHEKLDQVLELEQHRGSDRKRRIGELEKQLAELTSEKAAVLARYKLILDENDKLTRRDERIQDELCGLLQKHGQSLQQAVLTELQTIQEQLWDLGQEVRMQLETVLAAVASQASTNKDQVTMDPHVRGMMDQIVDLIGPEYLRLGRRLSLPQQELERIEDARETFAEKTHMVLQSWLRRRERGGSSRHSAAHDLDLALRSIDKDIRLFNHPPISGPERQALRNCLQFAIDHVTDPHGVLDHLIALNELTPAGITFVQEMIEQRDRALSRLWHVSEYRGIGIVSRLALALERSHFPHVSAKLTDELEIQNSKIHSQSHPLSEDVETASPTAAAAQSLGSRPSSQSQPRSRPVSRMPRPRSKTAESVPLPVRPPTVPEKPVSPLQKEKPQIVWDRRPAASYARGSPAKRTVVLEQGSRISRV